VKILFHPCLLLLCGSLVAVQHGRADTSFRQNLGGTWQIQSTFLVREEGDRGSTDAYQSEGWFNAEVPTTVLNALVKNGGYPDPRFALNGFRLPDASDEFNEKEKLARFSHLPGQRNPWTDPWWFRTVFTLAPPAGGPPSGFSETHTWLHLDSINYRAEVWLNGHKVAGRDETVSMNQRFAFDVTPWIIPGSNCLAVKIWRVDHVGSPGTQLVPLANNRFEDHVTDAPMDFAVQLAGGYDCFPPVPDRYTGILQDVWVETTGPVTIRDPFVITELPLPRTDSASLKISTTLINSSKRSVSGNLKGFIPGAKLAFETPVTLGAGEKKKVAFEPFPVIKDPKIWWPNGYGDQPLYDLDFQFVTGRKVSHRQLVRFGVRQINCEMHERDGHYGRQIIINGQKVFARGGYIQPDMLLDWTPERIDKEVRYYARANLNLVYSEDIANPPDFLFDGCDRYGVMIGQCFYGCSWMQSGSKYPADVPLVIECSRDILNRYRNHPSLVMYMASNEGFTREEVYRPWRKSVIELDGTRFWVPSNGMPNTTPDKVQPWFRDDMPTSMTDLGFNTYGWEEPSEYYRRVREVPNWMFMVESGSASLPPLSSLKKFIPKLGELEPGPLFPLDATWAHHGANKYYEPYDAAVRRIFGQPTTVGDYVWQGHLVTADQHRAMFEAVNHRLWDITSGFTEWKINSAWPDVRWQIFDWFLKPMVSYYFIRRANQPVHVQLGLLEPTVTVVNHSLQPWRGLKVRARVLDPSMRVLYEKQATLDLPANCYHDAFDLPNIPDLPPVYFVRLDLADARGKHISENFYWRPATKGASMQELRQLPPVKLNAQCRLENHGGEMVGRCKVINPTERLAFFVQLALTRGSGGPEILPVLWEDNYFSLMPGESREISARFASADAGSVKPVLELGGWNVETEFECQALDVSPATIKAGEALELNATVGNTFLDGSRVFAYWDGQPVASAVAFGRQGRTQRVSYQLKANSAGAHEVRIGNKRVQVGVQP
jgi:hypothetical protein